MTSSSQGPEPSAASAPGADATWPDVAATQPALGASAPSSPSASAPSSGLSSAPPASPTTPQAQPTWVQPAQVQPAQVQPAQPLVPPGQAQPWAASATWAPVGVPPQNPAPSSRPRGLPTWLWVIVIIAVVLVCGTGGFLLSRLGGGGAEEAGSGGAGAAASTASTEAWATPSVEGPAMTVLRDASLEVPLMCSGTGVSVREAQETRVLSFTNGRTSFVESTVDAIRPIVMAAGDGQTVVIDGQPTRAVELTCGEVGTSGNVGFLAFYGADLALVAAVPAIFSTTTERQHLTVTGGVEQFRLDWTVDGTASEYNVSFGGPAGTGSAVYVWQDGAFAQQDFTWSGAFTYPGAADTSTAAGTAQAVDQAIQVGDASTLSRLMTPEAREIVESVRFIDMNNHLVTREIIANDQQVTVTSEDCVVPTTPGDGGVIGPWFPSVDHQAMGRPVQTGASMSQLCATNRDGSEGGPWLGLAQVDGTWMVVDVIYWMS